MPSHGKKYTDARKLVDRNKLHEPEEAVELVKQTATARFDETIECAVRLGVDPRHAEQVVRGAVVLPHGTGKETRVLVFAKGDKAREAEEAGADVVGAEDLVAQIQGGWLEFDVAVATPDVMGVIGRIGRILGPRGLMPNPRTGTVTFDVKEAVEEIKAGKIEYRAERAGIVHAPIGKASFEPERLLDNFYALMDALIRARPAAAKGTYVRSVSLASTMGPGVKIAPTRITRTVQEER